VQKARSRHAVYFALRPSITEVDVINRSDVADINGKSVDFVEAKMCPTA
jgi:hypothetical protein